MPVIQYMYALSDDDSQATFWTHSVMELQREIKTIKPTNYHRYIVARVVKDGPKGNGVYCRLDRFVRFRDNKKTSRWIFQNSSMILSRNHYAMHMLGIDAPELDPKKDDLGMPDTGPPADPELLNEVNKILRGKVPFKFCEDTSERCIDAHLRSFAQTYLDKYNAMVQAIFYLEMKRKENRDR